MGNALGFIDFLTYGAIGIALALSILSYQLLSKEQKRDDVRELMLKYIRTFFLLSITLSLFFGITEIIKAASSDDQTGREKVIAEIWNAELNTEKDITTYDKQLRIVEYIRKGKNQGAPQECDTRELEAKLKEQLDLNLALGSGFYANINKLRKRISEFADNNINLFFDKDKKEDIFKLLEDIFISLGEFESSNQSISEIQNKWMKFKANAPIEDRKYIFPSDISLLVRAYLDKFPTN